MALPGLRQIEYFLEICHQGSFRRAAERLGIAQPTLTTQIAALEAALGATLFERSRGGTLPTPLGRGLIDQAETLLHEAKIFEEMAKSGAVGPAGTHRLGVQPTIGPYLLPEVIGTLHDAWPNLRLHVREEQPRDLETMLIAGRHDLILTALPLFSRELVVDHLFDEPLLLVAAPDHPLASKTQISNGDLAGESLLALEDRYRFFDQVQELALRFGARLLREYESTSLDTLRQMIGMNMGLGFLPALYVRSDIKPRRDVVVLPMHPPPTHRSVGLAWRPTAPHRKLYRDIAARIRNVCKKRLAKELVIAGDTA